MVVAGHPLATLAGMNVLIEGGNAIDATIAIAATLAVVRPHACGVGGDFFALTYLAEHARVYALQGNGAAPQAADPQVVGPAGVPKVGPLAVTVPGAVDGWLSLHNRFGTMRLTRLLAPAIAAARDGFAMYPKLSRMVGAQREKLAQDAKLASLFLQPDGTPLPPGARVADPALAATLERIAAEGRSAFYEGPVAEQIAQHFARAGGWLSAEDLAKHTSRWPEPLSTQYRDLTVYELPPPSQGFILLQLLNIVASDSLADLGHLSAASIHLLVEAKKRAFADRNRYLGDPEQISVPIERLLGADHARAQRESIDPDRAAPDVASPPGHDTTSFAVVDRNGNAVSAIQSIFQAFGSGVYVADAGVLMNNRASAFVLDPGHPNVLAPGKRPAHTLTCYIAMDDEGPVLVGGTPGGHGQVQTNLQILTGVLDHGLSLQRAVEAPRWLNGESSEPGPTMDLLVEDRLPAETRSALSRLGHHVRTLGAWEPNMGSAKVIHVNRQTGGLYGSVDPRRDAFALGY